MHRDTTDATTTPTSQSGIANTNAQVPRIWIWQPMSFPQFPSATADAGKAVIAAATNEDVTLPGRMVSVRPT